MSLCSKSSSDRLHIVTESKGEGPRDKKGDEKNATKIFVDRKLTATLRLRKEICKSIKKMSVMFSLPQ